MQQVTVGAKYQVVIPRRVRQSVQGLKPGRKVSVRKVDERTITITTHPEDWVKETYGMMRGVWKDPIRELQKLRDEWER